MFDNVLHQNSINQLRHDIISDNFPGAVLFSGDVASGKLTCALETARILSCTGEKKGHWLCNCPSCLQHKALVNQNLLLLGPRDCTPEIAAASKAFVNASYNSARYLIAARYLFLRSVRKLTQRFNPILWQGDDKISKIASLTSEIDEELEPLDFTYELPESEKLEKSCAKILELCQKLENSFLYNSIPISQIRNMSVWAHLKSIEGKKTVIIENADRMLESVRNALLKILEEPPEDTVFILTTSRRNAVMPTILSRVRNYPFSNRSLEEQKEVISRVFHDEAFPGTIDEFLLQFLSVTPAELRENAKKYVYGIVNSPLPEISSVIKACGGFDPVVMLKIFLSGIQECSRKLLSTPAGAAAASELSEVVKNTWNNVTVYNQSVQASLEILMRDISKINKIHGNIIKWAVM